jgi:hypothetical protein
MKHSSAREIALGRLVPTHGSRMFDVKRLPTAGKHGAQA